MTPEARFFSKVRRTEGCWYWLGADNGRGYGQFFDGRRVYAHRWVYEYFVGPIPPGLHIDHLCRVPACVRPSHLEPVTHAENLRRGEWGATSEWKRTKTHCIHGHEYTPENTMVQSDTGYRACRACQNARHRAYRAAQTDEDRAAYNARRPSRAKVQ
jgi:hypothetical protein